MLFVFLSAACFLAFIYPFLIYPPMLLLLRKHSLPAPSGVAHSGARVALLFCAYNEERVLPSKIQNIRDIKKICPDIEVRVYTDCCTDSTVSLLRDAEDVLTVHEGRSRVGKAAGMSVLIDATQAEILIFTDAAVTLEPESASRLVSYFNDPHIGTVAGTLHYTNTHDSQTARTGSLYWRLEETIKRLESETGSTMGASGQIFATRRSLYPTVPANLLDDMIASISPIFCGYRVITVPDVHAFQRVTSDHADEFRRKRRIACRAYNTHRYLVPQLRAMSLTNRFKYISHKYIRWLSSAFLLLTFVLMLAAIFTLAGFMQAVIALILPLVFIALGRRFDIPIVSAMTEIGASIFATGVGVTEAIAGRTYQTWTPAKSRRR